jgi:hypothetical protein
MWGHLWKVRRKALRERERERERLSWMKQVTMLMTASE